MLIPKDGPCGYRAIDDQYHGREYATTRELHCKVPPLRITNEEWMRHPTQPGKFSIPVFNLYECGLDAECRGDSKTCQLLAGDSCR